MFLNRCAMSDNSLSLKYFKCAKKYSQVYFVFMCAKYLLTQLSVPRTLKGWKVLHLRKNQQVIFTSFKIRQRETFKINIVNKQQLYAKRLMECRCLTISASRSFLCQVYLIRPPLVWRTIPHANKHSFLHSNNFLLLFFKVFVPLILLNLC